MFCVYIYIYNNINAQDNLRIIRISICTSLAKKIITGLTSPANIRVTIHTTEGASYLPYLYLTEGMPRRTRIHTKSTYIKFALFTVEHRLWVCRNSRKVNPTEIAGVKTNLSGSIHGLWVLNKNQLMPFGALGITGRANIVHASTTMPRTLNIPKVIDASSLFLHSCDLHAVVTVHYIKALISVFCQ